MKEKQREKDKSPYSVKARFDCARHVHASGKLSPPCVDAGAMREGVKVPLCTCARAATTLGFVVPACKDKESASVFSGVSSSRGDRVVNSPGRTADILVASETSQRNW